MAEDNAYQDWMDELATARAVAKEEMTPFAIVSDYEPAGDQL